MPRPNAPRLCVVIVGFWLLGTGLANGAWAQTTGAPGPATLRLAQVVPRLPAVHFFATVENEFGSPLLMSPSTVSALIGSGTLPVTIGSASDPIAIVFLIDISASLGPAQVGMIKKSVRDWINDLGASDQAAIVTLGESVSTIQPFTKNRSDLNDKVRALVFKDQKTLLYQGLIRALDLSKSLDPGLPIRRGIVVLTDGMDDQEGGAGRQDVQNKLEIDPTPIYGIGASTAKNTKVDAALKDFGAIVRGSGGEFRRVEITTLEGGYKYLRNVVKNTWHLTTRCDGCLADGSTLVTRLFLTQGTASLSSEPVTVRAVGPAGEIVTPLPPQPSPAPAPPPPRPPPAPLLLAPPTPAPPPPTLWTIIRDAIAGVGWQRLALAVLGIVVVVAGALAIFLRPQPPPSSRTTRILPDPGPTRPVVNQESIMAISFDVRIEPGTQQHKQRLRLTPLGHNDLPAEEAVFDDELSVGRSPDNKVHIFNDTQVSGNHCTLSPKDGLILVRDAGSRNGTRVNGVPIEGFMHAEPDSILGVGRTELRMQLLAPGQQ